jgi:hypothetical protein
VTDATVQPPTYWFYGRFSPAPPKPLHVPKAFGIADVYGVNLMGDAFWIALPDRRGREFDLLMNEVEHLASVFAGAYAMKSELGMRAFVEAWVESRATSGMESTVGIRRAETMPSPDDQSITLQALTDVDFAFRTSLHWRAALRDIGLATVDYGDDAFLFAARSLECCARAISTRSGEVRGNEWDALASRIGFASEELRALKDPLAKARHAVAHGDVDDSNLEAARGNRENLLTRARNLVRLAVGQSELEAVANGTWKQPADDPRNVERRE